MGRQKGKGAKGPKGQKLTFSQKEHDQLDSSIMAIVEQQFDEFCKNNEESYTWDMTLNKDFRKYIHWRSLKMGFKSVSRGKEPNRQLTIYKNFNSERAVNDELFKLNLPLCNHAKDLLNECNNLSKQVPPCRKFGSSPIVPLDSFLYNAPAIVKPTRPNELDTFRANLPVNARRTLIMDTIKQNRVTIISAETGSGKTTQIPQYLLQDACYNQTPIRIICTQPRRLSTVSVATRVAAERGEQIGDTVGYQVRLECRVGNNTALLYCTTGILLNTLMVNMNALHDISYIIVDEIHERDKNTDFLLIILRDAMAAYRNLKLVLMSATMDFESFMHYFNTTAILHLEGRSYPITRWFLNDILTNLNYMQDELASPYEEAATIDTALSNNVEVEDDLNEAITACFEKGSDSDFSDLLQLIINEQGNVNLQNSDGITPLMAAARHNNIEVVEQLINIGADIHLVNESSGLTAWDYATSYDHNDLAFGMLNHPPLTQDNQDLATQYERKMGKQNIDVNLIIALLEYIHFTMDSKDGSNGVLVFLPGYEEIMRCNDTIKQRSRLTEDSVQVHLLHGSMEIRQQNEIFKRTDNNKQKIILATNIAETSLTIDDIRFVVDAGKVKRKAFDPITGSTCLSSQWISMASAHQRAGRAGRVRDGYAFHLYSTKKYNEFQVYTTPEMQCLALDELCLQTKKFIPPGVSINDFLQRAMDPPPSYTVSTAIEMLHQLGALDENENLTQLGNKLLQLGISPRFGKILIYSTIFSCLDPVATIVAILSDKSPFILPMDASVRSEAKLRHMQFAEDALSDHGTLLNMFNQWHEHRMNARERLFCAQNFLSMTTLNSILRLRQTLISRLRGIGYIHGKAPEWAKALNENSRSFATIKACLAVGLYPNFAFYNYKQKLQCLPVKSKAHQAFSAHSCIGEKSLALHPWAKSMFFIFNEKSQNFFRSKLVGVTAIHPLTLILLCGNNVEITEDGLSFDDKLYFKTNDVNLVTCRNEMDKIIMKRIIYTKQHLHPAEHLLINRCVQLFEAGDRLMQLPTLSHLDLFLVGRPSYNKQPNNRFRANDNNQAQCSRYYYAQQGPQGGYNNQRFVSNGSGEAHCSRNPPMQEQRPRFADLFPIDAVYLIIQPASNDNITIATQKCTWLFAPKTEKRVMVEFFNNRRVIVIFTAHHSNEFYGVAGVVKVPQIGSDSSRCRLEWLTVNRIGFFAIQWLMDRIGQLFDGKQLPGPLGQQLCSKVYQGLHNGRPIVGRKPN